MKGLTQKEKEILSCLSEAWNKFTALECYHEDESSEFRYKIHEAQYMIARRVAARVNPEIWTIKNND